MSIGGLILEINFTERYYACGGTAYTLKVHGGRQPGPFPVLSDNTVKLKVSGVDQENLLYMSA